MSASLAVDSMLRGIRCRVFVYVGADVAADVGPEDLGTIEVESKRHLSS